jgi:transcriptional regulator with XRE-family HTH domain
MQEPGATQSKIARKTGVAIGTIHNILNGFGPVREDIRVRIAIAYGKQPTFFFNEYSAENQVPYLTSAENRLIEAFRHLDPGRQQMVVEMIEGWASSGPSGIGGRGDGHAREKSA